MPTTQVVHISEPAAVNVIPKSKLAQHIPVVKLTGDVFKDEAARCEREDFIEAISILEARPNLRGMAVRRLREGIMNEQWATQAAADDADLIYKLMVEVEDLRGQVQILQTTAAPVGGVAFLDERGYVIDPSQHGMSITSDVTVTYSATSLSTRAPMSSLGTSVGTSQGGSIGDSAETAWTFPRYTSNGEWIGP
jgi:hypothetical protein